MSQPETPAESTTPFGHINPETLKELYELRKSSLPPKPRNTKEVIVSEGSDTDDGADSVSSVEETHKQKPDPIVEPNAKLQTTHEQSDSEESFTEAVKSESEESEESEESKESEESGTFRAFLRKKVACPLCKSFFDYDSLLYHLGGNEICTESQDFAIVRKLVGRNYQRNLKALDEAIKELSILIPNKHIGVKVKQKMLEKLLQQYTRFSGYTRIIGIDKGDPYMYDDELLAYETQIKKLQKKINLAPKSKGHK